jgi:hypothetical protein
VIVLKQLGVTLGEAQASSLVKTVDADNSGELDINEFTKLIKLATALLKIGDAAASISGKDKKKRRRKHHQTYSRYIYHTLKSVHPDAGSFFFFFFFF